LVRFADYKIESDKFSPFLMGLVITFAEKVKLFYSLILTTSFTNKSSEFLAFSVVPELLPINLLSEIKPGSENLCLTLI